MEEPNPNNSDFKAAHELGKIYQSFLDRKLLCDFFLESTASILHASSGYIFLSGAHDRLWLEASWGQDEPVPSFLEAEATATFTAGHPRKDPHALYLPLIVRNHSIGVACFLKTAAEAQYTDNERMVGEDITAQLAVALKNLYLHDENIKMARLATIGQTVGVVLHEIKNMVQLAKFAGEYLRMGIENKNPKSLKRGMAGYHKAMREMEGFISELMSLTRDYKVSPKKFKIQDILRELDTDFEERADHLKVELDFRVEGQLGEVEGEPRAIYRVLVNMVKNAIEARDRKKEHSYVAIRVRSLDENFYEVIVEDNGEGMSDEVKAKLFQAFFSTKGEYGTGLGLMIMDRAIKAHHGEVSVESELGKGTKFIIKLPMKLSV